MKKNILAVVLVFAMCFAFAGCGSNGSDKSKDTEKEKAKVTSITGSWECENIEVTDNGKKLDKDTVKTMFGNDFSSIFKMDAYGDGQVELTLMEEESAGSWIQKEGKTYEISFSGSETEDSDGMTAKLDGDRLVVTFTESYTSDDKEQIMEMNFIMKYLGKKSRLVEGWDVTLDDDEVYDMSNAMVGGAFVEADGMLYGDYGGKESGKGAFTAAKIKDGNLEDKTIVVKNAKVSCLSVYDGDVYGILDNEKIVKIEAGKTKAKTLYEGTCDYTQVTKDGICFTDENNQYCKIDLKGKNKETVLEKEVYYTYQVSSEFLIYQDDADGETLHVYNMKNGTDTRISDTVSYEPMLCGDYLYFYTPGSGEDMEYMCRVDMYSGKQEKAENEALVYDYYVTPDNIAVAKGGFVTVKFSEWDKFADKNSAGFDFYPQYSNGEIWITKCSGENFMGPKTFGTDDEKSIGYSYVKDE